MKEFIQQALDSVQVVIDTILSAPAKVLLIVAAVAVSRVLRLLNWFPNRLICFTIVGITATAYYFLTDPATVKQYNPKLVIAITGVLFGVAAWAAEAFGYVDRFAARYGDGLASRLQSLLPAFLQPKPKEKDQNGKDENKDKRDA